MSTATLVGVASGWKSVTVARLFGRLALTTVALVPSLAAQLPQGEAAFRRGDRPAARAAYERVLARDSLNVTALYRLALLDSWDGNLARSLERFARARRLSPGDEDIMVSQATVLAWAGRQQTAERLYDSILARSPRRSDALAGRARVVAWHHDFGRAEELWRAALDLHPDDPELLIGLAQTLYWRGRPALARAFLARARSLAPRDPAVLELDRSVRAALRPQLQTSFDGVNDNESNDFVAQEATYAASLGGDRRGTLEAGWRRVSPGDATSYGASGEVAAALGGDVVLHGGLGVRRLEGQLRRATTPLTGQLGLGVRPARYATVTIGYERAPFDETAALIASGFVIDALEAGLDASPTSDWSITASGGAAWVSDGNRRYSGTATVLARLLPGLQFGPAARILAYQPNHAPGYFAPDRFSVLEGQLTYGWQRARWGVRAEGGLGALQAAVAAGWQTEWHLRLTLSRGWGADDELALVGSITNSASPGIAQIPGYRSRSLSLRLQQGL
jgi:tetratricopeptide (TPR) repeat protein